MGATLRGRRCGEFSFGMLRAAKLERFSSPTTCEIIHMHHKARMKQARNAQRNPYIHKMLSAQFGSPPSPKRKRVQNQKNCMKSLKNPHNRHLGTQFDGQTILWTSGRFCNAYEVNPPPRASRISAPEPISQGLHEVFC